MAGACSRTRATCACPAIPAKTRSWSWSHDGQWLATSGADAAIVWPFEIEGGADGQGAARMRRPARRRSRRVAFHPKALVLAVGYEDGCILLVPPRPTPPSSSCGARLPDSGVTALAWDGAGQRLAFGAADGQAGVLTLPG